MSQLPPQSSPSPEPPGKSTITSVSATAVNFDVEDACDNLQIPLRYGTTLRSIRNRAYDTDKKYVFSSLSTPLPQLQ